jgi:DNA-binding CsgD family transcriptional regulator/tetratricopeptide (TPR) repeat protein
MVRSSSASTVTDRAAGSRPSAAGLVALVVPSRATLLERDDALGSLRAALERCRRGAGGVVVIAGEAGIGKTSLIRAFLDEAGDRARVLVGACEDLLTPRPLGPLRDMFRDAGLPRPDDDADRDQWIDVLLAQCPPAPSSRVPTVVVLEDVHWADDATLDVLRYLSRRARTWPVLFIVSYRDELPDQHPLRRVIGGLPAECTTRMELTPLSATTVTACAARAGRDPADLIRVTGGNPFYLTEVLASSGLGVPRTVRDAVIGRISGLPATTRQALELVSVIPQAVDWSLLDDVGELAPLEPAERAGIVVLTDGRVGFRHELARRAVESALLPSRRALLNRQVLRALEGNAAEPSRLVHHAVAAADDAAVARYAPVAAARAAAANAHREALAFARLALCRAGVLPAPERARMHHIAGAALYALNRFGPAAVEAQSAVRCYQEHPRTTPAELGGALLLDARMQTMLGEPDRALAAVRQALDVLEPRGVSPVLAHAYGILGNLAVIEADHETAVAWCRRSAELARTVGRSDLEAHALIYLGVAGNGLGDPGALTDLDLARRLADACGHHEYLGRAASTLATVLIWQGRHVEAVPYLEVAERTAREHGHDYHLFHTLVQRCHVDLYTGRWEAAERRLRELLTADQDPAAVLTLPLALLARLRSRRGGEAECDADRDADLDGGLAARAWAIATRSRQVHRMAIAGGALIEEAWLRGDAAAVRGLAEELLPLAERANLAYLRGEVLRYLRRTGATAEPFPGCPPGYAHGLAGDWRAAASAWAEAGNPYEEALELCEAPDAEDAGAGIRRLDELGATRTATVMRHRLRQRGVRGLPRGPQQATRQNAAGLTARQLTVLALLAERLTSAEIADRLYLSRRTVDNHVNAILAKLGVSSRRRAVVLAIQQGWLPVVRPA